MSGAEAALDADVAPAAAAPAEETASAQPRRRWRRWAVVALLAAGLVFDLSRPPAQQWSAKALLGAIHLYQHTLSPTMPLIGVQCRFKPTCSHYAEGAIRKDGALVGSARAVWRVLRCGPWTPQGTVDPP